MNASGHKFAHPRVLVIGGGLMGLWPAAMLAQRGCRVTVLESRAKAEGASWAAAGMLAPASESGQINEGSRTLDAFGAHSLALWEDWATRFKAAGQEICWRPFGALLTAFDDVGAARLAKTQSAARALDLVAHLLSPKEARQAEPALSPQVRAALRIKQEASVDPRLVMAALHAMVHSNGGVVRFSCRVQRIERLTQAYRVVTAEGLHFDADRIVLAAGFEAGAIEGADELCALLRPVKGQMLALDMPDNPVRAVIRDTHAYIVPRGDGRIIIGATSEPGRADVKIDAVTTRALHDGAARIIPALSQAKRIAAWSGVRPQSTGGAPLIGPLKLPGVFANCGHYRNGVLLAPASAHMLCAMVLDEDAGTFGHAFLPPLFSSC